MNAMTNDDFARAVMGLGEPSRPFKPTATYMPEGDCIEFVVAPDDYYAHRIDGLVTVYYSRVTGKVVGALIKGVKAFCQRVLNAFPGFRMSIRVHQLKLEHVFLAQVWTEPPTPGDVEIEKTYQELIQISEDERLSVDVGNMCVA